MKKSGNSYGSSKEKPSGYAVRIHLGQIAEICAACGDYGDFGTAFQRLRRGAIVGNFTGSESTAAVAAVGANSPIIGLIANLLGANAVIAYAIGRGEKETVEKAPSLCPFWAADWWRFWGNGSPGRCCFSPRDTGAAAEQFLKLAIKE